MRPPSAIGALLAMCLCAIGWEVPCTYAQKGPPQAERDAATAGIAGADGAARDAAAAVDVEVLLQRYGVKFSLWFTCEYDDPAGGVLDGAPDRLVLGWRGAGRRPAEVTAS